jgi:hypothetical protein
MPVLMSVPMPTVLSRLLVVVALVLVATAGITLAASRTFNSPSTPASTTKLVQVKATLVVPDVRRQAFVFAKGTLQEAGFAWRVLGGVQGYAANVVLTQTPAPGIRVKDTGAPVVKLTLSRNAKYPQKGVPEDVSPYRATALVIADATGAALAPLPSAPTQSTTQAAPTVTLPTATAPAATTQTTTSSTVPERGSSRAKSAAQAPQVPGAAAPAKRQYPQSRPRAFAVAGAPGEPLDEMPLPDRARLLGRWLAAHPKPTNANVRHWLYQNEWIVTGAKFGWWRGAEALRLLIAVDRKTTAAWGIGAKSQVVASQALAAVEARSR